MIEFATRECLLNRKYNNSIQFYGSDDKWGFASSSVVFDEFKQQKTGAFARLFLCHPLSG